MARLGLLGHRPAPEPPRPVCGKNSPRSPDAATPRSGGLMVRGDPLDQERTIASAIAVGVKLL